MDRGWGCAAEDLDIFLLAELGDERAPTGVLGVGIDGGWLVEFQAGQAFASKRNTKLTGNRLVDVYWEDAGCF